jgi:chromate transporter
MDIVACFAPLAVACMGEALILMQTGDSYPQPNAWQLLFIWGSIGLQSFGGGPSTLFLIRREFVERRDWLTAEECGRFWNLCNLSPGINQVALTILIGRKLGGVGGIAASLAGLLLPSATITCLLAAGFKVIQTVPAVQAMLRGIVPATAGIMLLLAFRFAQPLFVHGRKEGLLTLSISLALIVACTLVLVVFKLTVLLAVIGAALIGAATFTAIPSFRASPEGEEEK